MRIKRYVDCKVDCYLQRIMLTEWRKVVMFYKKKDVNENIYDGMLQWTADLFITLH